jgi:hypothetical protein
MAQLDQSPPIGSASWQRPRLEIFAVAFFPFAVALAVSLLGPELRNNLEEFRTLYTMGAALVLAMPAIFLYALGLDRPATRNLWRLFWTFALIAYLVHLVYAVLFLYNLYYLEGTGAFAAVVRHYRVPLAALNVAISLWWLADVVVAWLGLKGRWVAIERIAIQLLVVVGALVAVMPPAENHLAPLAYALAAALIVGLLGRAFAVGNADRMARW